MKKYLRHVFWIALVSLCAVAGQARMSGDKPLFTRDSSYEEYLHIHSNPDQEKITPIRVIRWMMGMRGQAIMPPTTTEFQPVFDAKGHQVRAVAAIAYKFF